MPYGNNISVTIGFTAPATAGPVFLAPWIYNGTGDPYSGNDYAPSMTAVLPGGVPVIDSLTVDPETDTLVLGMTTLEDVRYVLQQSIDLQGWNDLFEFLGDGEPMQFPQPMDETKEFFRFSILPYNGGSVSSE